MKTGFQLIAENLLLSLILSIYIYNILIINYFSDPTWIRTKDRRFRKPVLYPAELWSQAGRKNTVLLANIINVLLLLFYVK